MEKSPQWQTKTERQIGRANDKYNYRSRWEKIFFLLTDKFAVFLIPLIALREMGLFQEGRETGKLLTFIKATEVQSAKTPPKSVPELLQISEFVLLSTRAYDP